MRKLMKLVCVDELIEHPNADALDLAVVGGWQCCVKKGEFNKMDAALYVEIDSMLPLDNPLFAFLEGRNEKVVDGIRYARVKTMKLRGELSQGILFPVPPTDEKLFVLIHALASLIQDDSQIEAFLDIVNDVVDFDSRFGIIKYEPKLPGSVVAGLAKGNFPTFIKKTDQERYQNCRRNIEQHKDDTYEMSVKLDGSSFTAFVNENADGTLYTGVCSRNLELKPDQEGSHFVGMFNELGLDEKLRTFAVENSKLIAIQGELVGPGIQNNFEGLDKLELYVFSVWDIELQKYLSPMIARELVYSLGLNYVPVLESEATLPEYSEYQELADGKSGLNGKFREGIVYKSNQSDFTFKVISNRYLLKTDN